MALGDHPPSKRSGGPTRAAPPRLAGSPLEVAPAPDSADQERLRASLRALQRENEVLKLLVAIHDRLAGLVLAGADAGAITPVLAELVSRPVMLLDPLLQPIALEPPRSDGEAGAEAPRWSPESAYVARVLQTMAEERRAVRLPPMPAWGVGHGCVLAPIVVGDATLGYLAILEPGAPEAEGPAAAEADLLAAQHAATVYALALMRERMATEVTTQLRDELLEGLLLGQVADEQAVAERARRLGYDDALSYRGVVLVPEDDTPPGQGLTGGEYAWAVARRRRLLDALAELLRARAPRAIVAARRDEVVALVPEDPGLSPADLGRAAILYMASLHPGRPLTVGLGGRCQGPADIPRSYAEARRAVEVARRFGRRGEVVAFEALGLYRLLFQVSDPAELRAFVQQVLGPLLAYDRKHQTDFVRTLASYLANNASLQATARELTLHVNTALYRLQRIQAITGLDLSRADDRLLAQLALKILEGTQLPSSGER